MSGNGSPLVLLSPDDVAKYLAKPRSWIYGNWRSQGISFKKVGNALRCRQGDLNDWLDRQAPLRSLPSQGDADRVHIRTEKGGPRVAKRGNGLGSTPEEIPRSGRSHTWGGRIPLHFDAAQGKKIRY
ncbi:helix-turn-helix domain-containing protein [Streptomyces niveus]|uniref:helix-turn-helix domain-containing protein n=1 Tax=Streptomyces niveus TaxID=193462 RepID=UPI00364BFA02